MRLIDADKLPYKMAVNENGGQVIYVKAADINSAPEIRWISLSEGVPMDGNPVYVRTKNGGQFVARYNHIFDRFACSGSVCITHWMPMLPDPEEEEHG
jgi:hypothetical protein